MKREVGAELEVNITAATPLEISGAHGSRIHKLDVPVGHLKVEYAATVVGRTDPAPVTDSDLSMYLRPSRYAEADKFFGFAATEFGNYVDSTTLLEKVSLWVGSRLNYVPGSSDPIDGAVDTLLSGAGVCRDYVHLVVALLRAVNVPARAVSAMRQASQVVAEYWAVAEARDWARLGELVAEGRGVRGSADPRAGPQPAGVPAVQHRRLPPTACSPGTLSLLPPGPVRVRTPASTCLASSSPANTAAYVGRRWVTDDHG